MVGLVAGLLLLFPDLFEGERAGRERERAESIYSEIRFFPCALRLVASSYEYFLCQQSVCVCSS